MSKKNHSWKPKTKFDDDYEDDWGHRDSKRYDRKKQELKEARSKKRQDRDEFFSQQYATDF